MCIYTRTTTISFACLENAKALSAFVISALGGLFMGLVLMGKDKPVSKKDIEQLLNDLIPNNTNE